MTDKQIIIDGVDVNECDNHYIENNKHICKYNFEECKPKNEQCALYVTSIEEQLKRKEKKCEELKNFHINLVDVSKCEFCEGSGYCYIYSGTADFRWMCEENEDCQIKNLLLQLKAKEQECEKAKKIIKVALDDFNLEYGTLQYDRLLDGARELGIEVKDYE